MFLEIYCKPADLRTPLLEVWEFQNEEDCRWIEFIKCMRDAGLPIEVLIEYVALFQQGDSTAEARKDLLIEQRNQLMARMDDMQKTLERLDYKIKRYEQAVVPAENELKKNG